MPWSVPWCPAGQSAKGSWRQSVEKKLQRRTSPCPIRGQQYVGSGIRCPDGHGSNRLFIEDREPANSNSGSGPICFSAIGWLDSSQEDVICRSKMRFVAAVGVLSQSRNANGSQWIGNTGFIRRTGWRFVATVFVTSHKGCHCGIATNPITAIETPPRQPRHSPPAFDAALQVT